VPSLEDTVTVRHMENRVVYIFSPIAPEDSHLASGLSIDSKIRTAHSFVVKYVASLITHGVSTGLASLRLDTQPLLLLNSKDGFKAQGCLARKLDPVRELSADSW
jgi:hypothetical protein